MEYFYGDTLMLICKNGRKFAILTNPFCLWMTNTAKTVPLAKWRQEIDIHNALYVKSSVGDVNNFQFSSYRIKTKALYSFWFCFCFFLQAETCLWRFDLWIQIMMSGYLYEWFFSELPTTADFAKYT